ncbi:MAG: hypothetical protein L0Y72_20285 [Gemmataceae bacterium]|nr:hypothetical protein [Gemmataceae bacterium]MCI0741377.1 hypothetical protein [Gemmataceae bacterium]
MELWKKAWRHGLSPRLSEAGLAALRQALLHNDRRLIQKATTCPSPWALYYQEEIEAACALGFCAWQGDGLKTVGEVSDFFEKVCQAADQALGEPAACRFFLNWFDDTPRPLMRRLLLAEVNRALRRRQTVAA